MSDHLKLTVLAPERSLVKNVSVTEVTLTGSEGQIQILPGHADFVTELETGAFSYKGTSGEVKLGFISTGMIQVEGNQVRVLAETLELSNEIDAARARNAQKKSEDTLKEASLDEHQFKKYQLKLQRALIRQQVAGR